MFKGLITKIAGDPNERQVRKLQPLVDAINALEAGMERRTDAELRALTPGLRARLKGGDTLDDLLPEAFAAVREASKRVVDMRPFDVQLIGGIVLHQGKVAEMKTGEGKTLVATLPLYLNALTGRGVHLVTVNDYLARRDVLWMGPIYRHLGLSVGLLQSGAEQPAYLLDPDYRRDPYPGLRPVHRREAYAADVTYGTNNEFGFDYLRDNLALDLAGRVQRPLYYAIVDEVDNIFIDEARTPLIISGPSDEPVEEYSRFAAIARTLEAGVHYELEEKERNVFLTDEGLAAIERETGIENIYDEANYRYVHYMQQALKAQVLFQEGRDYIRQRKQIILIDQHTGRLMPDRRLSEGLHQAIEAKEGVTVRPRDVVSATVTIQNYFRMYEKLGGMSGTAMTEAEEFFKIYKLDVVTIPTNKPMVRVDHGDVVYRSEEAKLRAVAREILACHSRGQPVLVGTTSVELSERVSSRLSAERLQMAALALRLGAALMDADVTREQRAEMRAALGAGMESVNIAAWRKLARDLGVDPNTFSADNLAWIAADLGLSADPSAVEFQAFERALRNGIPHQVLNAKEHTREATVIARAGEPHTVTIATNMAGRGVDIRLGGELSEETLHKVRLALEARGLDPYSATPAQVDSAVAEVVPQYARNRDRVLSLDGLHILGTERHEARRIDNQLRGRSGRQGEPGTSRFYLSLEDDLMRRFGRRELIAKLMEQIGDDVPIEHGLVSRVIAQAQTSVEGYNFEIRKHLLEYDDVLNRQRQTIYDERLHILKSDDLRDQVWQMFERQVDEYLQPSQDESRSQPGAAKEAPETALFIGLDEVLPLILPSASSPFQGSLPFGGSQTAFPPFTISFIADQLAGPESRAAGLDDVRAAIDDLARRTAARWGDQLRQVVDETVTSIGDKYDESLGRYQSLLDEKIEDYVQLNEERGRPMDMRGLAQHLERTLPFRLSTPPGAQTVDDVHDEWQSQIEMIFHRASCLQLVERVQARLPADIRLDRIRPAYIPAERVADELSRALEVARTRAQDGDQLARLAVPPQPTAKQVLDTLTAIKAGSDMDFGRLDRLVGHVLGSRLDDLLAGFQDAIPDGQATRERLTRDLDRLRDAVAEKKGGRSDLAGLVRQLNEMVHLEIDDLAELLEVAVSHEYDKWIQRQLAEIRTAAERSPLADTSWQAIAAHLLAVLYTQRQAYDREHRKRATWMPRLPFYLMAQLLVADLETDELRDAALTSLRWAVEQREQAWGQQEFKRWATLSLPDLDSTGYDSLLRYAGSQALGDQRDVEVEDLDPDIAGRLYFVLALRRFEEEQARLEELPQAAEVVDRLVAAREAQVLATPVAELAGASGRQAAEQVTAALRRSGALDDPAMQSRLLAQPIRDWDRRTRDQVAAFLGREFVAANADRALDTLDAPARDVALSYLQRQRQFVDETRVQHFLVHERLADLPPATRLAAIQHLARARVDRLGQRKIANLEVSMRQAVVASLQAAGLFTDQSRRDELLDRPLADLPPDVRAGFAAFLAREQLAAMQRLADLEDETRGTVLEHLHAAGLLADRGRVEALAGQRLAELDAPAVRDRLLARLRADLTGHTMEELPAETRALVRRALDERDYFVDPERVSWYERRTLAQLPSEVLRGLEEHLGDIRLAALGDTAFRDLPGDTQNALLDLFDQENLLSDRAERLRLTQTGALAQFPGPARTATVRYLGRQWLVRIRDRRPPALDAADRDLVYAYLRGRGVFTDEFKSELFAYQRLDEFDPETQQAVEATVVGRFVQALDTQPVGALPADVQADIRAGLAAADYFTDQELVRRVLESPVAELPANLREAVLAALAARAAAALDADSGRPMAALPAAVQAALWRHLDEIGYFMDEARRTQVLGRRLADLSPDLVDRVAHDLARTLEAEVGDQPVADLAEDLRQGLRDALETFGHFDLAPDDARRVQLLRQPLGGLRREDQDALVAELGRAELAALAAGDPAPRLADLPDAALREAILAHLQAQDWFVDQARLEQAQRQPLRDLPADVYRGLLAELRQAWQSEFQQMPVRDLQPKQRAWLRPLLADGEPLLDESAARALRGKTLAALDPDIYAALVRDLGTDALAGWGQDRFQDLDADRQSLLRAFLGRRIMGRIERAALLYTISRLWIDYLTDIEDLRRGIGLEAYGQRDPLVEYKRKAFELFEELTANIRRQVVRSVFRYAPEPLRT